MSDKHRMVCAGAHGFVGRRLVSVWLICADCGRRETRAVHWWNRRKWKGRVTAWELWREQLKREWDALDPKPESLGGWIADRQRSLA